MPIPTFTRTLEQYKSRPLALLRDDSTTVHRAVLTCPAEAATSEIVSTILSYTGGIICVALTPERIDAFMLTEMSRPLITPRSMHTQPRSDRYQFCISVEAREGVTTGISAADRAHTIRILGDRDPSPRKLISPGHIFPVEARAGGVLVRPALPEGAVDLAVLSGFTGAALISELLTPEGALPSPEYLDAFALQHNLPVILLSDLIKHRLLSETLVQRVADAKLPTTVAEDFRTVIYRSKIHSGEHVALVKGEIRPETPVLTRVQLEFSFGDIFGGAEPSTRLQIHNSLRAIQEHGSGIFLYLRRPLKGQLFANLHSNDGKTKEQPALAMREYGLGAQILRDLGAKKLEILTAKKRDYTGIDTFGLEIVGQRPIPDYHSKS